MITLIALWVTLSAHAIDLYPLRTNFNIESVSVGRHVVERREGGQISELWSPKGLVSVNAYRAELARERTRAMQQWTTTLGNSFATELTRQVADETPDLYRVLRLNIDFKHGRLHPLLSTIAHLPGLKYTLNDTEDEGHRRFHRVTLLFQTPDDFLRAHSRVSFYAAHSPAGVLRVNRVPVSLTAAVALGWLDPSCADRLSP